MRLVDASLERPVTVFMVAAGLVVFGLVAASRLAVDLLPDISYPSLTVRTDLPDAAPGDVEQFVTRPVEEAVGVVPGLVRMHSISRPGIAASTSTIEIGTEGSDFDTLLAVYTGSSVDHLTLVAANDDYDSTTRASDVTFHADANTTYHIAIDGKQSATTGRPAQGTALIFYCGTS